MAEPGIDPTDEVPEADLLEQRAPLDPHEPDDEPAGPAPDSQAAFGDEADRLEQQAIVPAHDEDVYPHE